VPSKLTKLKACADHVLCIFPFEPALLAQHGIAATYVGHPLASVIPLEPDRARGPRGIGPFARRACGCPAARQSRGGDPATWRPGSLAAAGQIREQAAWHTLRIAHDAGAALRCGKSRPGERPGRQPADRHGQSHAALAACDVTLIASGTATLEAALFKRPMVIAYNMNWLTWHLMRRRESAAMGGPAQHPVSGVCGSGAAPGCGPTPQALARGRWLAGWTSPRKIQAT
jgi:lipid-A-disaccharide synthase